MTTPADLLQQLLRRDGSRPLLTWYDDSSGERVELSVATAANWAAKTANLLVDDHDLGPGDTLALDPPGHWLTAVVVLGAWTAGVGVDLRTGGAGVALPVDPAQFMRVVLPQPDALLAPPPAPDDMAVVTTERRWSLAELVGAAGSAAPGARVMTTLSLDTVDGLLAALVIPLAAGGSAVLVTAGDPARLADRADTERVTHTAGFELTALPTVVSG